MDKRPRLAVFLSGGGTTLQNLIDRIADGRLRAEIAIVVSNNRTAHGLVRAERAGIAVAVVDRKAYETREDFSEAMFSACREYRADLVCLAGFMQLIVIPKDFAGRVLNIHPALIPAFCGKGYYGHHVHEAVIASGAKVSGCTVHFADNQYDHGPIVIQRAVPVLDDDTPETLAERVFREECDAYPEAIRLVTENLIRIEGQRVVRTDGNKK
jgi:formyltetrahydrofolate-dependent phosphoribosylglycinamide formyltransferase